MCTELEVIVMRFLIGVCVHGTRGHSDEEQCLRVYQYMLISEHTRFNLVISASTNLCLNRS